MEMLFSLYRRALLLERKKRGFEDASLLFDEWVLATDEDRYAADLLVEVERRILNYQFNAFH
jgi:hypothetical protein